MDSKMRWGMRGLYSELAILHSPELFAPRIETRGVLSRKEKEVRMGLDHLLQLRDKQLAVIVQQPDSEGVRG